MLVIDSRRVSELGSRRFAAVLDDEFQESKRGTREFASKNNLAVTRSIRRTLDYNLKNASEADVDKSVLDRLREHKATVSRIPDIPVQSVVAATPTESNTSKAVESIPGMQSKKLDAKTDSAESTAHKDDEDAASGEKIQFLLQDQKDLSAKELEAEQRTQALLVSELTELTSMLKESTLDINKAVNLQNIQLSSMNVHAAENRDELDKQKQRMKESTTVMTTSIWTSIWLIVWVLLMFSGAYIVIRLFPAPRGYPTCPAKLTPPAHPEL